MSSAGAHHTDGDVPLYFDEFACEEPDSKEDADDEAEPVDPSFLQLIDDLEGVDSNSPDLYSVLGIAKDASLAEIRAAYKRLSLILHPDRHSSLEFADSFTLSSTRAVAADAEAAFQRVTSAYAILSDPDKRAIYDAYGHEGLNIQGWEISGSGKSAPELRLEYLLLKQKAQSEKQLQLTQPNSEFSVGVDLTDLFDRYLQEPAHERTVLPKPYINQLQLAQSVTAGITLSNAISLAGQLTARNGLGVGSGMFMWRHYCGKKSLLSFTTIDTELSYGRAGRGPGLAVRLRRPFGDRLVGSFGFSLNSVAIHSRGSHIAVVPALSTGVQFQLLPRTQIRFEWRWFLDAGLSSELVWSSPNDQYAVRLSVRLSAAGLSGVAVRVEKAVSWPWLNPPRGSGVEKKESDTRRPDWVKADEDELELQRGSQGRFFGSVDVNTTDVVELTMGAQCSLSVYSRLSGSFSFSLRRGVNVRLALQRGTQTYSVPIILSEQPSKVAAGYGFVVPILLFAAIRTLVYEPYLNKQLERAQMVRRNKLKGELARRRREALSTQSLMQQSASRIRNAESHIGGLIIVRAVYGCLPASGDSPTIPDVAGPLTLDVTVPIQALVNTSRLRLPPGRWSDIQGFYDPCMGLVRSPVKACALRRLRVTYTFRGTLHEVTVTENQGLAIPMAKHRTDET